ncbi:MAG: ABC transporter ATP-binding protein [Treponema sp.]
MLEVCNVTKVYNELWKKNIACKNVSFTVEEGEIASLLGLNGAGKSTILKIISGVLQPTSGNVFISGKSVISHPIQAKKELGILYENAPLYPDMTVEEFLMFTIQMRGIQKREAINICLNAIEISDLEEVKTKRIYTLSKGFKQRVAFASCMAHEPRVLILDEPTSNLDAIQLKAFYKRILQQDKTKVVLISTHNLELAQSICTKHILINKGEVIVQGSMDVLQEELKEKLQNKEEVPRAKVLELAFDVFAGVSKSDFFKN